MGRLGLSVLATAVACCASGCGGTTEGGDRWDGADVGDRGDDHRAPTDASDAEALAPFPDAAPDAVQDADIYNVCVPDARAAPDSWRVSCCGGALCQGTCDAGTCQCGGVVGGCELLRCCGPNEETLQCGGAGLCWPWQ